MDLGTVSLLLGLHFVGDFVLQSNWMAINKSKRLKPLLIHCGIYSLCFVPFFGPVFGVVTFFLHTLTDAVTSRLTSKFWFIKLDPPVFKWEEMKHYENKWANLYLVTFLDSERHWFFVLIGLDQLIHYLTLLWTLKILS